MRNLWDVSKIADLQRPSRSKLRFAYIIVIRKIPIYLLPQYDSQSPIYPQSPVAYRESFSWYANEQEPATNAQSRKTSCSSLQVRGPSFRERRNIQNRRKYSNDSVHNVVSIFDGDKCNRRDLRNNKVKQPMCWGAYGREVNTQILRGDFCAVEKICP